MKKHPKTESMIFIPVFNEERHIVNVIRKVREFCQEDLIILNDGSTDKSKIFIEKITLDLAQKGNILVLNHSKNEGYGQSIIDGLIFAQKQNYKYFITLDGDEQHEPQSILDFLKEIKKGKEDIISGSRYIHFSKRCDNPPEDREKINRKITMLINHITGFNLTDSFCGFKAYSVKSLKKLTLSEKGYGFPLQFWIQAYKKHLKIKEIPVNMIYLDKNRNFGDRLDNPEFRYNYYINIIDREVKNA